MQLEAPSDLCSVSILIWLDKQAALSVCLIPFGVKSVEMKVLHAMHTVHSRLCGLALALALGVSLLLFLYCTTAKSYRSTGVLATKICVFGSAETSETALQAAAQFPGFQHWFVVWGEDVPQRQWPNVQLLPGRNTTHASAWKLAIEAIHASKHDCLYYFATDDDLHWTITEVGWRQYKTKSPQDALSHFLQQWQPAVTTFGWPGGDGAYAPLQEMNALHSNDIVQPSTGFDNGAMIFHHSVVSFFIPIWLGSGFTPAYTIQHTFQNFFVPFIFGPHALRFNGLQYNNPPNVRHAYDETEGGYKEHITSHMKCVHGQWGAMLSPSLVTWQPAKGTGTYTIDMSHIAMFYNVTDSVISQHPFFLNAKIRNASQVEHSVNEALKFKQDTAGPRRCITHQERAGSKAR